MELQRRKGQHPTINQTDIDLKLSSLLSQLLTVFDLNSHLDTQFRRLTGPNNDMVTQVQVTLDNKIVNVNVSVRQHEDHELTGSVQDIEGEPTKIKQTSMSSGIPVLTYQVTPLKIIRTRITIHSIDVVMQVSYLHENNSEDASDSIKFYENSSKELPFPLQKKKGERPDGWIIRNNGNVVMKIYFEL
jgi:hypothetical protein